MSSTARSVKDARISVVVPVFNEEQVLPMFRERVTSTLERATPNFEVILVDDGSTDATPMLIDRIHSEDARFKCVRLSRNFGHQAALTAGLHYASGDVTCVLDADLQDPPEVLLSLLSEWEKGNDVVYAIRRERKEHWIKVSLYNAFYRVLARLSSVSMPLDAGDFCLLSRDVLQQINRLPEKERFVRGLRAWVGFKQVGVSYEREARLAGESKYSLFSLLRLAMNGIVSFSDKPLLYVMIFGLGVSLLAFLVASYLVVVRLAFGGVITGYASLMSGLLLLSGIQLVAMGVVGVYLSKVFQEVKARPTYIVASVRGLDGPPSRQSSVPRDDLR